MNRLTRLPRRIAPVGVVAALLALMAGLTLIESGGANGVNQYNAASITITGGTAVTWQSAPDGRRHDVTSAVIPAGATAFYSGDLDSDVPPATFSSTLTATGTYTYFCSFHASATDATLANVDANIAAGLMVGKVGVQGP